MRYSHRHVLLSTVALLAMATSAEAQTASSYGSGSSNTVSSFDRERGVHKTTATVTSGNGAAIGTTNVRTPVAGAASSTSVAVPQPNVTVPTAGNFQRNPGTITPRPGTTTAAPPSNISTDPNAHMAYPGLRAIQAGQATAPTAGATAAALAVKPPTTAVSATSTSSFARERGQKAAVTSAAPVTGTASAVPAPPKVESTAQ